MVGKTIQGWNQITNNQQIEKIVCQLVLETLNKFHFTPSSLFFCIFCRFSYFCTFVYMYVYISYSLTQSRSEWNWVIFWITMKIINKENMIQYCCLELFRSQLSIVCSLWWPSDVIEINTSLLCNIIVVVNHDLVLIYIVHLDCTKIWV